MSRRRRLRIISYSDEEDDDIELELQAVTLNSSILKSNPNPSSISSPIEPVQLEISDDDMEDHDNVSPPSPLPPAPPPPNRSVTTQSIQSSTASTPDINFNEVSYCPITSHLRNAGLRLRREWLDSCIQGLESSVPGFPSFDSETKAKHCFEQFLYSDMNCIGAGVLPENVHNMHLVDLAGPFVLQVDEIVNISFPLRQRYQDAHCGIKRCLKLSMTDGVQVVFAMEYRPIKDLQVLAPSGLKVAICNVNVRHGLLMLVPEVFTVLGGSVEELDAARQRLVNEVNKPPRGKRTRRGVVPPLATRATLAAWPPTSVNVTEVNNGSSTENAISFPSGEQGSASGIPNDNRTEEDIDVPVSVEAAEPNSSFVAISNVVDVHVANDVEHPLILTGEREIPFTYLASLSAKWAATRDKTSKVQGKIKCFLTGVKGFQYRQRSTFELLAYVDDGSLISEVFIDHNVVQKEIGHSPKEVTDALYSSDKKQVSDMKETLKQYQSFLANFEGIMTVEMNRASLIPIVIEMNQGCPASDAWLLLRRMKSFVQFPQHSHIDPICLSP